MPLYFSIPWCKKVKNDQKPKSRGSCLIPILPYGMTVWPKLYLWRKWPLGLFINGSISKGSIGENCVANPFAKFVKNAIKAAQVALVFCMKLYRKLAVLRFQNWSQGQMAGKRSCKLGTIAHLCLVSRAVLGNFDIHSPSNFFMSFLRKIARFWEHDLLRAISWKRNKNSKIPSTL